jgi:hypothetical protein
LAVGKRRARERLKPQPSPSGVGWGLSCVYARVVILRSAIASSEGERRELEVVAASFEQGVAEIEAQMPDGWRRLHVIIARA